jgi:AraC-like DNA-binding protein
MAEGRLGRVVRRETLGRVRPRSGHVGGRGSGPGWVEAGLAGRAEQRKLSGGGPRLGSVGRTAQKQAVAMDLLPHLRQAHDHIDRHYASPIGLDELARVAGVSKYHFARSFEAAYGLTPIRYLTRRRVERAQDLLRHANLTVTEICFLVGFSSLGSFSSLFNRLVGESPTAYRDRWAARGGPHVPGCYLFMRGPGQLGAGATAAGTTATATEARAGGAAQPDQANCG